MHAAIFAKCHLPNHLFLHWRSTLKLTDITSSAVLTISAQQLIARTAQPSQVRYRFTDAKQSRSTSGANYEPHDSPTSREDEYWKVYTRSLSQPEDFWRELSSALVWDEKKREVLDNSNSPFTKWFPGWKINVCYNALDRHCDEGRADQIILHHESPVTNSRTSLTYGEILKEVKSFAAHLAKLGIKKGDRVVIYMPMIPQAITAMLACARIGAIHSVVFGGFAAKELATRISHAKAVAIVCGSHGIERSRQVDYKKIVDDAINLAENKPKHVVVFQRPGMPRSSWVSGRDSDWNEAINSGKSVDCVPIDAADPLYILYTSGTTGTPKAVVRPAGGYAVALHWSMYSVYGMRPGQTWWSASDLGWVVGHSYICYAPLLHGNPSVLYEGKVTDTPDASSYFRLIERYKVRGMFTTPTAMRALRQADPDGKLGQKHDVSSLELLYVAGEHCDEGTKVWTKKTFNVPVLDNWWQTESGWPMTSTCTGLGSSLEPPAQSSGHAVPGYDIRILDSETGKQLKPGETGRIVARLPLPPGFTSSLWENDSGFKKLYFERYPGYYDTMDAGGIDADGYVTVSSRMDDIINVSGVRISTSAIEEAVLRHPDLVECAVIGVKDNMKGQVPVGLLVVKSGCDKSDSSIVKDIVKSVRDDIGPVASFKSACVVPKLPKTKSGKIARPSLICLAEDRPVKVPVTIEDPDVYGPIQKAMREIGYAKKEMETC